MTDETVKPQVVFVNCNGILCPFRQLDYTVLSQAGLRVFKIAKTHLDMLRSGLLKGYTLRVLDFDEVYPKIIKHAFKDMDHIRRMTGMKDGERRMRVIYTFSKQTRTENTQALNRLAQYFGRFCFQIKELEWKNKTQEDRKAISTSPEGSDGDVIECNYRIVFNPDIDPSLHYNEVFDTTPQKEVVMDLSRFSRIRLLRVPSLVTVGVQSVCLVFEDRAGNEWREALRRTFEIPNLQMEQVSDVAGFLLGLAISKTN